MKRALKIILAALLSLATVISLGACKDDVPPEETPTPSPSASIGPEIKEPSDVGDGEHPEDAEPFTAYRMEAESAVHSQGGAQVTFDDNTHVRFSTLYSGGLVTGNLSAVGTVHTFTFNSDKALSGVTLIVSMAVPQGANAKLSDMIEVRMNNSPVNINGLTMNYNDCVCLDPFSGYAQYMYFKQSTMFVTLEEGENVLEIEHVSTTGGNFDYVELQTSALISGFDNGKFWDTAAVWEVASEPTVDLAGALKMTKGSSTRTYVLPVLSAENGYAVNKVEGGVEYSFTLKGEKYAFIDDGKVIPEDEGPYTAYRMESEYATHYQNGAQVTFNAYSNLRFSTLYSGCLVTSNLSADNAVHEFKFNSDRALKRVPLAIMIATNQGSNTTLAEMIDVKVNGASVSLDGLTMNYADCVCLDPFTTSFSKYMYFKEHVVYVTLKEGANVIEITHVTSTGGNLDYIELRTSAQISGFNETVQDTAAVWTVTAEPTLTATGTITMKNSSGTRTYTLPKLSAENGYEAETVNGATVYSFTLQGVKYDFTA